MNTTQSLALIYQIAQVEMGNEDAKKTVSGVVYSVINELEAADLPVTEENIAKSLAFIADKFSKATKRHVA